MVIGPVRNALLLRILGLSGISVYLHQTPDYYGLHNRDADDHLELIDVYYRYRELHGFKMRSGDHELRGRHCLVQFKGEGYSATAALWLWVVVNEGYNQILLSSVNGH